VTADDSMNSLILQFLKDVSLLGLNFQSFSTVVLTRARISRFGNVWLKKSAAADLSLGIANIYLTLLLAIHRPV